MTRQQGCTVLSAQGHSEAAAGCEEPTGGGVREGGGSGAKTGCRWPQAGSCQVGAGGVAEGAEDI